MDEMTRAKIRKDLSDYINQADDKELTFIRSLVLASDDVLLTEEQARDLEVRIDEVKAGNTKSYTWAEARALILKRR